MFTYKNLFIGHWTSVQKRLLNVFVHNNRQMIEKSFVLLEKISLRTEQKLWQQGISDWEDFINTDKIDGISQKRKPYYERKLREASRQLYEYNSAWFMENLPMSEYWRLYGHFKDDTAFIDIETTGLGSYDDLTVFGIFDGLNTKSMIRDINLNFSALKSELGRYKLLVTFNGASFDIPFIRKRYPDLLPAIPNIDLRFLSQRLGYRGGLKQIEKDFGIKRRELVQQFNGGDALTLWRMYKSTGDDYYLNLLVEYNEEDVMSLKTLMGHLYGKMSEEIKTYSLPKQISPSMQPS
jgi:uncharacterized protein YprB with RNaseH-like and TPR domain